MADNTAASWLPARGRFSVTMGPSFNRALKLRKNEPPPNSRHERHYHVLRSSFKPATVDIIKPGAVEFHKHEDARIVKVERPSTQTNGETHLFSGRDLPTKDVDCILIFDEDTKTFTLEKVDSVMNVTFDKKIQKEQRAAGSPMPSSGPSTSASSPDSVPLAQTTAKKLVVRSAAEQTEAETRGAERKAQSTQKPLDEGSKKAPVDILNKARNLAFTRKGPKKPVLPPPSRIAKEEGEASEGEIVENPRIPPEPVRAPAPATSSTSQPANAAGPARKTLAQLKAEKAAAAAALANPPAAGPPPPKAHALPPKPAAPSSSPKKASVATPSNKRSAPEEPPAKASPPKRARASPPPTQVSLPAKVQKSIERPKEKEKVKEKPKEKEKFELALPGGPGLALPGAPSAAPKSASLAFPDSGFVSLPPPPPPSNPPAAAAADDDSEEEEWDDVLPTATPAIAPAPVPPPPALAAPLRMITMEEIEPEPTNYEDLEEDGVEIDEDMLAQELDEHLGDDDMSKQEDEEYDFLSGAISPVIESQPMPSERRPLSMAELMGNQPADGGDGDLWGDDDDSSSSDDSDDD